MNTALVLQTKLMSFTSRLFYTINENFNKSCLSYQHNEALLVLQMLDHVGSCVKEDATTFSNEMTCTVSWEGYDP